MWRYIAEICLFHRIDDKWNIIIISKDIQHRRRVNDSCDQLPVVKVRLQMAIFLPWCSHPSRELDRHCIIVFFKNSSPHPVAWRLRSTTADSLEAVYPSWLIIDTKSGMWSRRIEFGEKLWHGTDYKRLAQDKCMSIHPQPKLASAKRV